MLGDLEVKCSKNNRITLLAFVLIYYCMYIIVQSTIVWKPFWKQRTVSIKYLLRMILISLGVITFFPHELPKNAQCPHELPTRPK
jgi:hypothetical protein